MYFLFFYSFFFLFFSFSLSSLIFSDSHSICLEFLSPFFSFTNLPFVFMIDYVSLFFFSAVSLISGVVFFYSKFYMGVNDNETLLYNNRFFVLLFLFVLSMFFLVFSGSWLVVMLGWDGLGLISFLLVIFYSSSTSLVSGLVTILTNRIGDCFFLLGFMLFFFNGYFSLESYTYHFSCIFFFFLFLGMITKSAQVPFSSWLPAAMAAPTPVSSLVHSSTLVTAGVYLFVRFNYIFYDYYLILSLFSLVTMIIGGLCAVVELDFKKVVAMSTLSQLGFMIFSVSMGFWQLCLFHMIFHAYFKSSLFLATGGLMHYLSGGQDSRFFGSMSSSFFSKLFFSASCLSLMGFPFTLGFYSKDLILGVSVSSFSCIFTLLFLFGCLCTVAYSFRLISMSFSGPFSSFSSFSFVDEFYYFFPVFFLFLSCLISGQFYFFNLMPLLVLGVLESFVGIAVILLGALLFFFSRFSSFIFYSLRSMVFMTPLSSSVLSFLLNLFPYKSEYTWGELSSAKAVEGVFFYFGIFFYLFSFLTVASFLVLLFYFSAYFS